MSKTYVSGTSDKPVAKKDTKPLKIGTHGGAGSTPQKRGSHFITRSTKGSRRSKQFDSYSFANKTLRNPTVLAKELSMAHGVLRAHGLAQELAAKGAKAVKDGETVEYMTLKENKRNAAHWATIAGYLSKRLEVPMSKW